MAAVIRITRELIEIGKDKDFKILNFEFAQYTRTCVIEFRKREYHFTFFETYPFRAPTIRTEETINGTKKYSPYIIHDKDWNAEWSLSALIISIDAELNEPTEKKSTTSYATNKANYSGCTSCVPYTGNKTTNENTHITPYNAHRHNHEFSHGYGPFYDRYE